MSILPNGFRRFTENSTGRWATTLRRSATAGVAIAIMATGAGIAPGSTIAKDHGRVIPITASDQSRVRKGSSVGDSCTMYLDFSRYLLIPQQVVIRDENNTIIAIADLEGTLEDGIFPSELQCKINIDIPVPEAKFYTVYLGDQRIVGFSADNLPTGSPFDAVWIGFD